MSPDPEQLSPSLPPSGGWPLKKISILTLLVLVVQVVLVLVLGEKKPTPVRPIVNAPHFQIADDSSRLMALDNPTLFALPHTNDFAADFWLRKPEVPAPSFVWTEPPRWLPLDINNLGRNLHLFMSTNTVATIAPVFKPEPELATPKPLLAPRLNDRTTMQIHGELAGRLIEQPELPSLTNDDLLAHTRVQILVNAQGTVISVVAAPAGSLVPSPLGDVGENNAAQAMAQELARRLRFAPSHSPATFGQVNFNWHTVLPADATATAALSSP